MVKLLFILLIIPTFLYAHINVAGVVNGQIFLNTDVEKKATLMAISLNQSLTEKNKQHFVNLAIEALVNEKLFKQRAQELNLEIPPEKIQTRINNIANQGDHQIPHDSLVNQITSQVTLEQLVRAEVLPYITVSENEVEDYKESRQKEKISLFELARVNEQGIENYLGLLQATELSTEVANLLKDMKIGDSNTNINLKLLDRLNVDATLLDSKFDIVKVFSQEQNKLEQFFAHKDINCNNYNKIDAKDIKFTQLNDFADTTNKAYKQSLKMAMSQDSKLLFTTSDTEGYYGLLLCDVKNTLNTLETIQNIIFQNKLETQTTAYIKELRRNSSIIIK